MLFFHVLRWVVAICIFLFVLLFFIGGHFSNKENGRTGRGIEDWIIRIIGVFVVCAGIYIAPIHHRQQTVVSSTTAPVKVPDTTIASNSTSSSAKPSNTTSNSSTNTLSPTKVGKVKNEVDSTADVKKLSSYMHENYGASGFQTSWYSLIKSYKITNAENGKEVSVYTSIYPDADGKQAAMDVANAIVFNNAVEVYDVTVYGVNNTPLAYKSK